LTADKDSLIQAFLNLTLNAIKALKGVDDKKIMIESRIKSNILIDKNRHPLAIEIKIMDNGCGVPEELAEQIFYPMISGFGSTGLGLNITQNIINNHLGVISYQRERKMTVFKVLLPIIKERIYENNLDIRR
jgi:two-component system nitrogen regulation sensor histidine kinase GlnL